MNKILVAALFLGVGSLYAEPAQTPDKPPLPSGPLLAHAPPFSKWEITYSYGSKDSGGEADGAQPGEPATKSMEVPRIKRISIVHTKPLWHAESVDNKGNKDELWFDGTTTFSDLQGEPVVVPKISGYRHPLDLDRAGFVDLDWISPETFVSSQTANGNTYLIFQQKDITVWIDGATRFPIMWQRGDEKRAFRQLEPPTSPITLPAKIANQSAAIAHDIKMLVRPPSKFDPPVPAKR
jgi:hypothetical protein